MFNSVLASLGKYLWGNASSSLMQLPSGEFYGFRRQAGGKNMAPLKECLFKDANMTIMRVSSKENRYTLVIQRIYEEGEAELEQDEADGDASASQTTFHFEYIFDVTEAMQFKRTLSDHGSIAFQWSQAPTGSAKSSPFTNTFEFVPDSAVSAHTLQLFHYTMAQCIYEFASGKPFSTASETELEAIMANKPFKPSSLAGASSNANQHVASLSDRVSQLHVESSDGRSLTADHQVYYAVPSGVPFFRFDPSAGVFVPLADRAHARILSRPNYEYRLSIESVRGQKPHYDHPISPSATQHVDRPTLSFIWNFQDPASTHISSYSLRFSCEAELFEFANAYARSIYEILNKESSARLAKEDADYLMNPFLQDVDMHASALASASASESESASSSESESEEDAEAASKGRSSRLYSASSSARAGGASSLASGSTEKNSQLAIGYKYDRSFVSRGSSIGVFKHTEDDGLEFQTNIKNVRTLQGDKPFSPSKMMLHDEDSSLVLMNPSNKNTLYKLDLEMGKVVEEWKVDDYVAVTNIVPDSKYAPMTPSKTLIGLNANSIFRIDPRLAGTKKVEAESKSYVVKNDFSCGATTGRGELAVASAKGDIRLFNKLDKRAKTLLPGFGDPIIGIDVTENGKYLLATCKNYLLLISTQIEADEDGRAESQTGFSKSMGSQKPIPKRLHLKPEHVAYMGEPVQFTEAHFSTGFDSEERSIIASTGRYVITWNLKSIHCGKLFDYQIKKYSDIVVADNFKFGQDKNIVVTLPNQVTMVSKSHLLSPNSKKWKDRFSNIVDSPY